MDINKYSFVANHDNITQAFWKWFSEIISYSSHRLRNLSSEEMIAYQSEKKQKYSENKWDQIVI